MGKVMVASNNVQQSRPDVVALAQGQMSLACKFMAPGPGEFVISVDTSTGAGRNLYLYVVVDVAKTTFATNAADSRGPLWTKAEGVGAITISMGYQDGLNVITGNITTYTTGKAVVSVKRAGPVYIVIYPENINTSFSYKNLTVSYDVVEV